MFDFLKICGWGILAVILSPLWVAALLVALVVATTFFLYNFGKATILFFCGKSIFEPLPEDKEARKILDAEKAMREQALKNQLNPTPQVEQPRLTPLEQTIIDAGMAYFQKMANSGNPNTPEIENASVVQRLANKDGDDNE